VQENEGSNLSRDDGGHVIDYCAIEAQFGFIGFEAQSSRAKSPHEPLAHDDLQSIAIAG
jgi:hypothetical protein